jgi:ABC-type antimicrobial peptide transport system permease subunit
MAQLAGKIRPVADVEREVIESAIEQCNSNIRKAAALLGISAPTIYRKKAVWDDALPLGRPFAHGGLFFVTNCVTVPRAFCNRRRMGVDTNVLHA